MKVFVASDIHGSFLYAKKMIEAYEKEQADFIILLGDILYHGPRNDLPDGYAPKDVITLLNNYKDKIICVRGNCDAEVDQMVLQFPIMDTYKMMDLCGKRFLVTHGHVFNKDTLPNESFDILLHGHTHVPTMTDCGKFYYCNPGSTTIPKEGSEHSYIIIDENGITWKSLEGDSYLQYKF